MTTGKRYMISATSCAAAYIHREKKALLSNPPASSNRSLSGTKLLGGLLRYLAPMLRANIHPTDRLPVVSQSCPHEMKATGYTLNVICIQEHTNGTGNNYSSS